MTKKTRRIVFVTVIFGVAAISAALVLTALSSSVAYFYTPSDLQKLSHAPTSAIRLGGLVKDGSVQFASGDETAVSFVIRDEIAETPVTYRGILPDLFREGQGVVVQGAVGADGVLAANEVLAKHDETYMPKEVADALKKQGRWKEGESR